MSPTVSYEVAALVASLTSAVEANETPDVWHPGSVGGDEVPALHALLGEIGSHDLAAEASSIEFVGPAAVVLGRHLVAVREIDLFLGGSPLVGGLVRYADPGDVALVPSSEGLRQVRITAADPVSYGDSFRVRAVKDSTDLGLLDEEESERRQEAWMTASVGYLAGLASEATSIAIGYCGQREAFGQTLLQIEAVQQRLADAATTANGLMLLAEGRASAEELAYAGPAACSVLVACHQVVGAIGYVLEFPLQRYSRRCRAMQLWADAWMQALE